MKISSSLSIQGKILKWQDISSFGKILDGAIRAFAPFRGRVI